MTICADELRKIIFLAPDLGDVSTGKRVKALLSNGFDVLVFSFRRDGWYNKDYTPPCPTVDLGTTYNSRYLNRITSLLKAMGTLYSNRGRIADASAIYSRNIDQLVLALFCRLFIVRAPIVYEVLDIVPVFIGNSLKSRLFRSLERTMLRSVSLLLTSSAPYVTQFYQPVMKYAGAWGLVENKLGRDALPLVGHRCSAETGREPLAGFDWIVGYFGTIKGMTTFNLIRDLAVRLPRVKFLLHGIVTSVDPCEFENTLRECPNLEFGGAYVNPDDLPTLYARVDMTWALDLANVNANSLWCMACRFYESGAFGIPLLAVREQHVGQEIDRLDMGWTFSEPYADNMEHFFRNLTRTEYEAKRRSLLRVPLDRFVDLDGGQHLSSSIREMIRDTCKRDRSRKLPPSVASV
jgi:succinoglycan biosynthesis protein ExoL